MAVNMTAVAIRSRTLWKRGDCVPNEYHGRNYVVNYYCAYHLNAPPGGYQVGRHRR